jgi:hypothetical protein
VSSPARAGILNAIVNEKEDTMTFHLNTIIKAGSHKLPSEGACTMEIACLVAGFGWHQIRNENDLPKCMSRVIGAYVIRLNDAMPDDPRQRLMAFVPRLTTTRGTVAEEQARAEYLVMNAAKPAAIAALRSARLHQHADAVAATTTLEELLSALAVVRSAVAAAHAAADTAAMWAAEAAMSAKAAAESAKAAAMAAMAAMSAAYDWTPYLDALDGALKIGPQADPIDEALIRERTRVLMQV